MKSRCWSERGAATGAWDCGASAEAREVNASASSTNADNRGLIGSLELIGVGRGSQKVAARRHDCNGLLGRALGGPGRQLNLDLTGAPGDGFRVNMKTLGKILTAAFLCVACVGYASSSREKVTPMGNDTFSITREARTTFTRSTDKLKEEVTASAEKFCQDQGKQMRLISLTGKVPMIGLGYATATIVFRALNAGDPGLTSPLPVEGAAAAPSGYAAPAGYAAAAEPAPRTLTNTTDDLYNALTKLDDLRKKGILTDEEFQAEKKKILSRSN